MTDEHVALKALLDKHEIYPKDGDDLLTRVSELLEDYHLISTGTLQHAIEEHNRGMQLDQELHAKGQARRARLSEHQPDWAVKFEVLDGSKGRVTIPHERIWAYIEACNMLGIHVVCESHDGVIHTVVKAPGSQSETKWTDAIS